MFVGGVVIEDEVEIAIRWSLRVDELKELEPFLMAMPILALPNQLAVGHIERRKQGRGAVADIIMRHGSGASFLERQSRLRAIERLDLALLIAAENDRMLGRIQIEADHILELLHELRVVGDFEGPHQMRLQSMRAPDAPNRAVTDIQGLGERTLAPLGRLRRPRPQRALDDEFSHPRAIDRFASAARSIKLQPRAPAFGEALAPARRLLSSDAQRTGDLLVIATFQSQENDPAPLHQALWRHQAPGLLAQPLEVFGRW